jgi:transcriptional regulator with XRE-family HTH domain
MDVLQLQKRLKQLGRTQTDLAAHLGLTHGQISRILSGKSRLRVDTLQSIEAFLVDAERRVRGVGETGTPFSHGATRLPATLFITMERAMARRPEDRVCLTVEERDLMNRELCELGEALKRAPIVCDLTEDEILGYGADT